MNTGYFRGLWDDQSSDDRLPNGYTRKDYYDNGFTDFDIEYWGLDQSSAPEPAMAGWVIWDALDGELDGEIDSSLGGEGTAYTPVKGKAKKNR